MSRDLSVLTRLCNLQFLEVTRRGWCLSGQPSLLFKHCFLPPTNLSSLFVYKYLKADEQNKKL